MSDRPFYGTNHSILKFSITKTIVIYKHRRNRSIYKSPLVLITAKEEANIHRSIERDTIHFPAEPVKWTDEGLKRRKSCEKLIESDGSQ